MEGVSAAAGDPPKVLRMDMDMGWVFKPVYVRVVAFSESVLKYPNIKAGQDFSGY